MYVYLDLNNTPHSYDRLCLYSMNEVSNELRPFLKDLMEVLSQASVTRNILVAVRNEDGQIESGIWVFDPAKVHLYYDKAQVFLKSRNIPFTPGAPPLKDVIGFKFPL